MCRRIPFDVGVSCATTSTLGQHTPPQSPDSLLHECTLRAERGSISIGTLHVSAGCTREQAQANHQDLLDRHIQNPPLPPVP